TDNALSVCLLVAAVILVNYLFFLYLFGIPVLLLTNSTFCSSWKKSLDLLKRRKVRTVGKLFSYILAYLSVLCVAWGIAVSVLAGLARYFHGENEGRWYFGLYYNTFAGIWNIVTGAIASVFFCAITIVLYHCYKGESRPRAVKKPWTIKRLMIRTVVVLTVIVMLVFMGDTELGRQFFYSDSSKAAVIAHRAGAAFAPENTVAALNEAIEDGANMAEIDVQQLNDGTLIVLHDTNFKRTTGVDLNVWDAEYTQVEEMDAGSCYSHQFAGEPVPALEDMLKAAKGKIDLMIELKVTGHEKSLVEDTLELIEKYDMEKQCNIASMDFNLLQQVKSLNTELKATYISVLLVSKSYDLKQIDCYSVETTFLSRELVSSAHAQGKMVYGWTASSNDSIKKVLSCDADGVITDNPLLVRYIIDTSEENILMDEVADIFF
ncbi:glycerophosphodiester phosphodiesterase, partial [Lawsonibacter sp. OA9]